MAGSHPGSAELPRAARRAALSRRWGHFTATSSGTSVSSARSARSTSPSPRAVPGSAGGVRLGLTKDAVRCPRDPANANLGGDGHPSGGPGGGDGGDEQRRCGEGCESGDGALVASCRISGSGTAGIADYARNSSSLLFVCVTELHLTINSQNLHTLDVFLLRLYTTNTWHERRGVTNHMAPGRLRPYKPEGSTFTTNYPPGREFEARTRTQSKQFFAF